MATLTDDEPAGKADDYLNRGPFAQNIADIILGCEKGASFRIGVYGDWGEGKTSVLRMVDDVLTSSGHVTLWLSPWGKTSNEALLRTLLDAIADRLGLVENSRFSRAVARASGNAASLRQGVSKTSGKAALLDALLGGAYEQGVKKLAGKLQESLLPAIYKSLAGRKLVIFVDDLDRARPEILPEFLLSLRELLSFDDFFFVLGLAPDIVHEGLAQVHQGWAKVESFLEKIIEIPRYLPEPQAEDLQRFADAQVTALGGMLDREAALAIADLLPRNPRKLKLTLRYLAGLRSTIDRFSESELSVSALYVAQMLRFEFPAASRFLLQDASALADMDSGSRDRGFGSAKEPEKDPPEFAFDENARYRQLCQRLRESHDSAFTSYSVSALLRMTERPPILTWKESGALLDTFAASDGRARTNLLREFIDRHPATRSQRAEELFIRLLSTRELTLETAISTDVLQSEKALAAEATIVSNALAVLIEEIGIFRAPLVSASAWHELLKQALRWWKFTIPAFYEVTREEERRSLTMSVHQMSEKLMLEAYSSWRTTYRWEGNPKPTGPLAEVIDSISQTFREAALSSLLARFRRPGGIGELLPRRVDTAEKWEAVSPQGMLASPDARPALEALAADATSNEVVHANFFDYVSTLFWGAYGHDSTMMRSDIIALFSDESLVSLLWKAALAKQINRRMMGSLVQYRDAMLAGGTHKPESVPVPDWYLNNYGSTNAAAEVRAPDVTAP
jgi:hypothetical protein